MIKGKEIEAEIRQTFQCPNCGSNKVKEIITQDHVIVGCNNCRNTLNKYCVYKKMDFNAYVAQTVAEFKKASDENAI